MSSEPQTTPSSLQHFGGFILAGAAALSVDVSLLRLLSEPLGLSPFVARIFSISVAMVVSWGVNRQVTFAITARPSWSEFTKFAAVSWIAQVVNYTVFAVVLLVRPLTWPVAAVVVASLIAMFVSYAGFRFGVFRKA